MENYYSAKVVSSVLGIQATTLRKYSSLLEVHNYRFKRDYSQNRLYSEADIDILRDLQESKNNANVTLFEAARILTQDYQIDNSPDDVRAVQSEELDKLKADLENVKKELEEIKKHYNSLKKEGLKKDFRLAHLVAYIFKDNGRALHEYEKEVDYMMDLEFEDE